MAYEKLRISVDLSACVRDGGQAEAYARGGGLHWNAVRPETARGSRMCLTEVLLDSKTKPHKTGIKGSPSTQGISEMNQNLPTMQISIPNGVTT